MNLYSRGPALILSLVLLGLVSFVSPATSAAANWAESLWAESLGAESVAGFAVGVTEDSRDFSYGWNVRYGWGSSGAFERAAKSPVFAVTEMLFNTGPGAALRKLSLVRFLKRLPLQPIAIGPTPRLPYENTPALGMAIVYRFDLF